MKRGLLVVIGCLLSAVSAFGQTVDNYIINADIGQYVYRPRNTKTVFGNSGILIGSGHFVLDHDDVKYSARYILPAPISAVDIQVTKHAGSMSDKWLLHELDKDFRNYYGIPATSYAPRIIAGQTVCVDAVGGRNYRWISGEKTVVISYHGSLRNTPEPIEVLEVYLNKHPSTLGSLTLTELRSNGNVTAWIKNEMSRRLWLADKWLFENQNKGLELGKTLREMVDHMTVFLNYREKYFGVSGKEERPNLVNARLSNDGTTIKNKLTEYKVWWEAHKDDSINL